MKAITRIFEHIKNFIYTHILLCMSVFALTALAHATHAFSINTFFDTDDVIYYKESMLNWLEIGRQGAVLTKKLFGLSWINPYFIGALCLLLFPTVILFMNYLFYSVGMKKSRIALYLFSGILIASPVWAYQFYFTVQWFEVLWGMLLIVLVAIMFFSMFSEKRWIEISLQYKVLLFLIEVLMLVWSFSTYQSLVLMFIALCAGSYLISLSCAEETYSNKEYAARLIWMLSVFFTAFVINSVLTVSFFNASDYVSGQRVWGVWDTHEIIEQLKLYFVRSNTGADIQYSWLMGIGTLLVIANILFKLLKKGNGGIYKFLYLSAGVTVCFSAHAMIVYTGAVTAIRSQINYPLVMAFLIALSVEWIDVWALRNWKNAQNAKIFLNGMKTLFIAVAVVGIWIQFGNTCRLWYTDDIKCRVDLAIAQKVSGEIEKLGYGAEPELPVVFIGNYSPGINEACLNTSDSVYVVRDLSVGISGWERVNETSNRVARMFHNQLGLDYVLVTGEQVGYAQGISKDMPVYPNDGYVQVRDGMIIVKMSDNY